MAKTARIADAIALQDDMMLVGVADVVADWRIGVAVERDYPVYAATAEARQRMENAAIPLAGGLEELLGQVDVVVDCTPSKRPGRLRSKKCGKPSWMLRGSRWSGPTRGWPPSTRWSS